MRSLFAFLGAALVAFLALGWFLDWYKISSSPTDGGRRQVNVDLNIPKIGEDFKKGEQKAAKVIENVTSKGKPAAPTTTEGSVVPASKTPAAIVPAVPAAPMKNVKGEEEIRILPAGE